MSTTAHLNALKQKHAALGQQIIEIQSAPSSSDFNISALKRQKLNLKDAIEKLQQQQ